MFEIKAGDKVNQNLRVLFPAIGYRLFRQLGEAPILVADDPQQPLDGYELNLFAAKPDRVETLSQQGFLVDLVPAWTAGVDNCKVADLFWRDQKFAQLINLSGASPRLLALRGNGARAGKALPYCNAFSKLCKAAETTLTSRFGRPIRASTLSRRATRQLIGL